MTTRSRRVAVAVATIAICFLPFVPLVSAQSHGLTLSTRFPGLTVKPGEQVTLSLNVANDGPSGLVHLAVAQMPEGWEEPSIRGGGFEVDQVYVADGQSETVTLDLKVPEEAAEGSYEVLLTASHGARSSDLPLRLTVARTAASRASLTTEYPSIRAQAGTSYTFQVTLRNESDSKRIFALSANSPKGWGVTFKPAYESKQVGSVPVDAGASLRVDVTVEVPDEVETGLYKVPVLASAGALEAGLDLELEVMGKYELSLNTPTGRLSADVTSGRENPLELEVRNTGTVALEGISFSTSAPPGWSVTFSPERIDRINPGEQIQVTAKVRPDDKAIAGDYLLTIWGRAEDSAASDNAEFRVAVRTSTLWGMAGLSVLAAVGGGLWWVFHAYGRR
ncbi:MAG: NEW3 domain-containing protein [Bacillota bacterium]